MRLFTPLRNTIRLTLLGCWLTAGTLAAQYTPPGSALSGADSPSEEDLRTQVEDARWRWGVFRLQPWIGVRDASFVTTSAAGDDDFTISAGAGLRSYLKTGEKVIWAAHALPEYVWWQDNEDKRGLNGRYGVGLFTFFHRLDLEISLRRNETQRFFSPEVQELTTTRRDIARFGFEVRAVRRFFVYGNFTYEDVANQEEESFVFGRLDQEKETARLGVRYRSPRGFWLGGGGGESTTDFTGLRNLSNTGDSIHLDAGYEGARFSVFLNLERLDLEGRPGSAFVDLETTSGYLETRWDLHRSAGLFLYGRRQLGYSVREESSSILSDRIGARLDFDLRGSRLGIAAEFGEDDYESTMAGLANRRDDVIAFSALMSFDLRNILRASFGLTHTEYDSGFDEFDRDITAWTASLQLLSLTEKLRFGESDRIW